MEKYFKKAVKLKNGLTGTCWGYYKDTNELIFKYVDFFGKNQYIKIRESEILKIL